MSNMKETILNEYRQSKLEQDVQLSDKILAIIKAGDGPGNSNGCFNCDHPDDVCPTNG
jgi:hypothetical protein